MVLGVEEFLPCEGSGRTGLLDQGGQRRDLARRRHQSAAGFSLL
jgi:hypothetical protein